MEEWGECSRWDFLLFSIANDDLGLHPRSLITHSLCLLLPLSAPPPLSLSLRIFLYFLFSSFSDAFSLFLPPHVLYLSFFFLPSLSCLRFCWARLITGLYRLDNFCFRIIKSRPSADWLPHISLFYSTPSFYPVPSCVPLSFLLTSRKFRPFCHYCLSKTACLALTKPIHLNCDGLERSGRVWGGHKKSNWRNNSLSTKCGIGICVSSDVIDEREANYIQQAFSNCLKKIGENHQKERWKTTAFEKN